MNQFFDIACELDIATKNYAGFIKLGSKNKSEKHTMFTPEEIQKLFECVFCEPLADTVLIRIYTDMMTSEICWV